jgi:hypothetical protein
VAQRQHVLEHHFVRLRGAGATPCRVEPEPQDFTQPLRSLEPLMQKIALAAALRELGMQSPAAREARNDVTEKEPESAHLVDGHPQRGLHGDNSRAVPVPGERLIATLWQLAWEDDRVCCAVYRGPDGLLLRLESVAGVIVAEPFDMDPRGFARTRTLREALKRRGWKELKVSGALPDAR